MEARDSWGRGEGWAKVMELIALAKSAGMEQLTPERRERIYWGAVEKAERQLQRRRLARAFAAGASTVLLVGVLLRLIVAGGPPTARCSPELAAKAVSARLAAE